MLCYVRLHYAVIWYMVWCSTVLRCLSLLYQGISFQTRASIRVQGFGVYTHLSVCQNFLFMARPWMIWGGSYRLTTIRSHVSVRYRFALVKVRRLSDSLILLVACPALIYCPVLLFTALCCPLPALYCPLLHFTALHWHLLPSAAPYCMGQWLIKRSGRYRLGID